jgi:protein-S-isoprenylcysteine O-methyltransferase Ste14
MSFALYLIGYLIFVAGVLYAEHLAHVHSRWMGVTALVLIGLGILTAVKNTRQKDPAA